MKKLLLLISTISISILLNGQVIESSCTAPDSIINMYQDDADALTLRKFYDQNSPYIDSVHIPSEHSDTILNALIAVWNAVGLPARDTVIDMFNIHSREYYSVNYIGISADSNLNWIRQLTDSVIPCGHTEVDALIDQYGLFVSWTYVSQWLGYYSVGLSADYNFNSGVLARKFMEIEDVMYVDSMVNSIGDGNRIDCQIHMDHVELDYSLGWGDCPSGCICRRFWKFKVYFDCSVEYCGSTGCIIDWLNVDDELFSDLSIFPNPCNDFIQIDGLKDFTKSLEYTLYNISGRKIKKGTLEGNRINLGDEVKSGMYFLELNIEDQKIRRKIHVTN